MRIEWDPNKAEGNADKHGVTFHEAATVFGDSLSVTLPDPDHSSDEERYLLLGRSAAGRLLIVAITERGYNLRIISARPMTPRERRAYEHGAGR
jgi:hypothetical protein